MKRPSQLVDQRASAVDMDSAMTPMIDVVFLLLIFFVWTASFQIVEQILPSEMSSQLGNQQTDLADPPPEADFDKVIVRIGWNGTTPTWNLNKQPVDSLDTLRDQLAAIAAIKADALVILDPDSVVPLGNVIEVFDLSKLAGFVKVSFAVSGDSK